MKSMGSGCNNRGAKTIAATNNNNYNNDNNNINSVVILNANKATFHLKIYKLEIYKNG